MLAFDMHKVNPLRVRQVISKAVLILPIQSV